MFVDSCGKSPQSVCEKWISIPSNIFELTSTTIQLMINGTQITGYLAVKNLSRPNYMGIGIINKRQNAAIKGSENASKGLNRASIILAAITVGIQVGEGIYIDINRGYTTD